MANVTALGSRMGELHHSPSLLGSTDLPFSLDGKLKFSLKFTQKNPRTLPKKIRKIRKKSKKSWDFFEYFKSHTFGSKQTLNFSV